MSSNISLYDKYSFVFRVNDYIEVKRPKGVCLVCIGTLVEGILNSDDEVDILDEMGEVLHKTIISGFDVDAENKCKVVAVVLAK